MEYFTPDIKNISPVFKGISLSLVDSWIISYLKVRNSVPLSIMVTDYAKERGIKKESARKVLERRLKILIEQGIVERLNTYPISYKLKRLPKIFLLPSSKSFKIRVPFDLSYKSHKSKTLGKSEVPSQKIQQFRKLGLRVITRANKYRQRALLTAQFKPSIRPGSPNSSDIAFLYNENIKEWNNSVIVLENDNEEFMLMKVRTRFNDKGKAFKHLIKSQKALKNAFTTYRNALMITLTIPHIFPLVVPIRERNKVIGFIPLQDSIITQLRNYMMAWIRKIWRDRDIKVFTAYEYHGDYVLHLHVLVFGIPYLLSWNRQYGRKGEDVFTYYSRKYNIPIKGKLEVKDKTQLSKHIFTALLDKWLQKILIRFGSALGINLLEGYLRYKEKEKLQGPVNEIHRVKDGRWVGKPPKDALIQYSSGAAYREVISPDSYVLKYVIKMIGVISSGGGSIDDGDQAKVYGYWLFGKRFNSFSPSLLPKQEDKGKESYWHFIGVFNKLDLPDYVINNVTVDLT